MDNKLVLTGNFPGSLFFARLTYETRLWAQAATDAPENSLE